MNQNQIKELEPIDKQKTLLKSDFSLYNFNQSYNNRQLNVLNQITIAEDFGRKSKSFPKEQEINIELKTVYKQIKSQLKLGSVFVNDLQEKEALYKALKKWIKEDILFSNKVLIYDYEFLDFFSILNSNKTPSAFNLLIQMIKNYLNNFIFVCNYFKDLFDQFQFLNLTGSFLFAFKINILGLNMKAFQMPVKNEIRFFIQFLERESIFDIVDQFKLNIDLQQVHLQITNRQHKSKQITVNQNFNEQNKTYLNKQQHNNKYNLLPDKYKFYALKTKIIATKEEDNKPQPQQNKKDLQIKPGYIYKESISTEWILNAVYNISSLK